MIIHFFLLAALCTISSLQANEIAIDDKILYGQIPPFSTDYIKRVPYEHIRVDDEQYKILQEYSLTCINRRIEEVVAAYKLASNFYTCPPSDKAIIFSHVYNELLNLRNICAESHPSDRPGFSRTTEKKLLYHIQWVRTITLHNFNYNDSDKQMIELTLYDNTSLKLSYALTTRVLEHLKKIHLLNRCT